MKKNEQNRIIKKLNDKVDGHKDVKDYEFLENDYIIYFHDRLVKYVKVAFLFCILLVCIFMYWDYHILSKDVLLFSSSIKFFIIIPLFLFLYNYSTHKSYKANFQNTVTMFGSIVLLAIGLNIATINFYGFNYDYDRVIIALVAIYTLSGLEHKRALFLGLLLTFIFIVLSYIFGRNGSVFISGLISISLINIMGSVYTYKRDQVLRSEFLKTKLLKVYANNDPLTGLYNRRYINKAFAKFKFQNISMALIDIDYFKQYNDHYGHNDGDECLIKVSNILSEFDSKNTFVCRYGGEEFLILCFDNDFNDFINKIENIKLLLDRENIPHKKSEYEKITLSIGASYFENKNNKLEYYTKICDDLLYKSKKDGRNKITFKND